MIIKIERKDIEDIVYHMTGLPRPCSQKLSEYLWENGLVDSFKDILEYGKRTSCYTSLRQAAKDLCMDPKTTTWEDILDRDDVEYVDNDDEKHQIIVRD